MAVDARRSAVGSGRDLERQVHGPGGAVGGEPVGSLRRDGRGADQEERQAEQAYHRSGLAPGSGRQ